VDFEHGLPVGLGGERMEPLALVTQLNDTAGKHGVGRLDAVEDFAVGVKTRIIYEAPAAEVLHCAHRALEEICLSAEILRTQRAFSRQYSDSVYRGDWFTPLRQGLDAFFAESQKNVTGSVRVRLFKGVCTVVGRESRFSLYDRELATGGEHDTFDHRAAHGYLDILAVSRKLQAHQREKE
jgi:argininosuccinate synthase